MKNQSKNSTSNKAAKQLKDRRYHQRVVRSKKVLDYIRKINKDNQQMNLARDLKKSVEHGKNGTQRYVIKEGENKGKIV